MSRIEEFWIRRSSGAKILLGSIALGVVGMAPLLLYIAFGPKDGNPIGLGLLAVLAEFVGAIGVGIGLIVMLIGYFRGDGR
jgi:hypothetical protein